MNTQIQFEAYIVYEREKPISINTQATYQVRVTNTLASVREIFLWMLNVDQNERGKIIEFGYKSIEVEVENSNVNS